jgi:hypothetical protein
LAAEADAIVGALMAREPEAPARYAKFVGDE